MAYSEENAMKRGSLILALALLGLTACGSASTPVTQATPHAKQWVTVQSFQGTTDENTAAFHVPDGARILWSGIATGDNATLAIGAYDGSTYVGLVGGGNLPSDGTTVSGTYVVPGAHTLSLHIAVVNGGYTIGVEVFQ